MSVYMFPGQGSQHKGMGAGLFERHREEVDMANDILGYSIEDLCLEDPRQILGNTRWTQPALFTVNALHYLSAKQDGLDAQYFVGHSLGEYNALHAAGMLDFATGLTLTMWRGELMSRAEKGGMAAVIGAEEYEVRDALARSIFDKVYVAGLNAPTQIVISGAEEQLVEALGYIENATGATCTQIKVSGAFHSPLMETARRAFDEKLAAIEFGDPQVPVIANVDVLPYSGSNIRSGLSRQLTNPVRWTETIRHLKQIGESDFCEVGPGRVLTRLVSRIIAEETGEA